MACRQMPQAATSVVYEGARYESPSVHCSLLENKLLLLLLLCRNWRGGAMVLDASLHSPGLPCNTLHG